MGRSFSWPGAPAAHPENPHVMVPELQLIARIRVFRHSSPPMAVTVICGLITSTAPTSRTCADSRMQAGGHIMLRKPRTILTAPAKPKTRPMIHKKRSFAMMAIPPSVIPMERSVTAMAKTRWAWVVARKRDSSLETSAPVVTRLHGRP